MQARTLRVGLLRLYRKQIPIYIRLGIYIIYTFLRATGPLTLFSLWSDWDVITAGRSWLSLLFLFPWVRDKSLLIHVGAYRNPWEPHGNTWDVPSEPMVFRGIQWVIPIVPAGSHGKTTGFHRMRWGLAGIPTKLGAGFHGNVRGIPWAPTTRPGV